MNGNIIAGMLDQNPAHLPGLSLPLNDLAVLVMRYLTIAINFYFIIRIVAVISIHHLLSCAHVQSPSLTVSDRIVRRTKPPHNDIHSEAPWESAFPQPSRSVLMQRAGDQGLIGKALLERPFLDRLQAGGLGLAGFETRACCLRFASLAVDSDSI